MSHSSQHKPSDRPSTSRRSLRHHLGSKLERLEDRRLFSGSPSAIVLAASPTTVVAGNPVTLNATLFSTLVAPNTGTVTFKDGSTTLGTVTVTSSTVTLSDVVLSPGTHTLSASYSGDPIYYQPSSSANTGYDLVNTVAGNGGSGETGNNGPATAAELQDPEGVAVDSSGDVYIADNVGQTVREVKPNGTIIAVAGNGTYGYGGLNGPATLAAPLFLGNNQPSEDTNPGRGKCGVGGRFASDLRGGFC